MSSHMLTMSQAAEYCGIKIRTWQAYYQVWECPHYRVGKHVLFSEDDLNAWLASKRVVA